MNLESISELVMRSKAGDREALETLLVWAHTPVSYLCRTILQDAELAQQQIHSVLRMLSRQLYNLEDPELFEKWACQITAESCMQVFSQLQDGAAANAPLRLSGKNLDRSETVDLIQQLVDRLPGELRTTLVLYCCAGMKSQTIADVMGVEKEDARENLSRSQTILQKQIDRCMERGIQFAQISSLVDILRSAMYQYEDEQATTHMVWDILGIGAAAAPEQPQENRAAKAILWVLIVLVSLIILLLAGMLVKVKLTPAPEVTLPTWADTTVTEPEETEAPTEERVGEAEGEELAPTEEETTVPTEAEAEPAATESTKETEPKATAPKTEAPAQSSQGGREVPEDAPATAEDGHTHRYLTTKTNFNCETGGERRYECADCDYYYTETLAPTGSHNFNVIPNAGPSGNATCTAPGKALQTCTKCNYAANVEDPSKPALGHNYTSTTVAPTETEQGYTKHTCDRCGDTYKDNFVEPTASRTEQDQEESTSGEDAV